MGARIAAVLPIMIVMLGCSSEKMPVEEMPVEELPAADMSACEAFEPPVSEKQADEMTPREVVEQINWGMRAKRQCNRDYYAENPDQLYDVVYEILLPRIDRQLAAQRVLGKHWKTASEKQRERFINAFHIHAMKAYTALMLNFPPDGWTILGEPKPPEGNNKVKVKTFMTLDVGAKVPVNYSMVERENGWLIYDVTIEGISYVRAYREELNAEIQAKGLYDVIERLKIESKSVFTWFKSEPRSVIKRFEFGPLDAKLSDQLHVFVWRVLAIFLIPIGLIWYFTGRWRRPKR